MLINGSIEIVEYEVPHQRLMSLRTNVENQEELSNHSILVWGPLPVNNHDPAEDFQRSWWTLNLLTTKLSSDGLHFQIKLFCNIA